MTARQNPEVIVDAVVGLLRSKMETTLVEVRTDRHDPRITTEKPASYFISERNEPTTTPAVFVLTESCDFQKEMKGANHVNARINLRVHCIVEDRDTEILTRRLWRYLAAIQKILDQAILEDPTKYKAVLNTERYEFTPSFVPNDERGAFRNELMLSVTAYVYENF